MSEKRTRVKRPPPARTSPIRDFSTVLHDEPPGAEHASPTRSRKPATASSRGATSFRTPSRTARGSATRSFKNRYARASSSPSSGRRGNDRATASTSPRCFSARCICSTDLGALLFDVTSAITRTGAGEARRADGAPAAGAGAGAHGVANARLSVEIEARGHTKVMLDLAATAIEGHLHVPALYSLDGASAPLTHIVFDGLALRVQIPDEQPPGTYSGVVVDQRTNEPRRDAQRAAEPLTRARRRRAMATTPTIVSEMLGQYGASTRRKVAEYCPAWAPRRYLYDLVADYPHRGGKMMRAEPVHRDRTRVRRDGRTMH